MDVFVAVFPCRELQEKNGFPLFFHYGIAPLCRQVGLHTAGCTWYPSHLAVGYHSFHSSLENLGFLNVASDVGKINQNIEGNLQCWEKGKYSRLPC